MSFVASAVIAGVTSIAGGLIQADSQRSASNKAAGAATRASQDNNARFEQQFNDTMALLSPYIESGKGGLDVFQALGGFYNPENGTVPRTFKEYKTEFNRGAPAAPVMPTMPTAPVAAAPSPFMNSQKIQNFKADPNNIFKGSGGMQGAIALALQKQQQQKPQDLSRYNAEMAKYNADKQAYDEAMAAREGGKLTQEQFIGQQRQQADNAQRAEIQSITNGPLYQELLNQGQNAILQNASATGGLRGGNTQGALANFSAGYAKQLIDQKMSQALQLSQIGQSAAVQAGQFGSNNAANMAGQTTNAGVAQANNFMNQGNVTTNLVDNISSGIGSLTSAAGNFGGGGGGIGALSSNAAKASSFVPTSASGQFAASGLRF